MRRQRGGGGRSPTAGPDRADKELSRIAGQEAVEALIAADPRRLKRLYATRDMREVAGRLSPERGALNIVGGEELTRIAGTHMHGGIVALAQRREVRPLEGAGLERLKREAGPVLVLDGVGNPQNLGAIARSAAFFGVPSLVLSDHPGQAMPSDASYRIAKGGLEYIAVYRATRLPVVLKALSASHLVVGTALGGAAAAIGKLSRRIDPRPVALVLGNEEEGLPAATLAACAEVVRIPGAGRVQSLNVSATAAVLLALVMGGVRENIEDPGKR